MNELAEKVKAIGDTWTAVYLKASAADPALWQPHWPNGDLVLLDEMVRTLVTLFARDKAPKRFAPGYQLGRSLVAIAVPGIQSSLQQLAASQFNHLPTFLNQVATALSRVHLMLAFSDKETQNATSADLSAQQSESIALLGTAQRELAEKKSKLEEAQALADAISSAADTAAKQAEGAAASNAAAAETLKEIEEKAARGEELSVQIATARAATQLALKEAKAAQEEANTTKANLAALLKATEAQSAVIASILPKGASAGLAAAFSSRGRSLELTKWAWMAAFVLSLAGLAIAAFMLKTPLPADNEQFWTELLWRLTRATPLVWVAWVSIVQYGNTVRVQEDYAFKEATSKAFQGYRDHMEHLRTVDTEDAGTALNLMAVTTIEILGREPLRIYDNTGKDASPAHSLLTDLLERFKKRKSDA